MPLTLPPDPEWVLGEADGWAIMLNRDQSLLGRSFLVLLRPETDVTRLTDAEVVHLWAGVRRVKAALDALWAPDHYNFAFLMNLEK